jgi:DNA-binding FadR family transcriptional regulator
MVEGVDGRQAKLAATIAARIVRDVARRNWPVGEVIGSETELLERYGASRAVVREAVRLVEHQHVASMRRGPGGGLVVTEPDVDAVIDASIIYLLRAQARLDEVFDAREVLETIAAELAPGRMQEADLVRLRQLIADEHAGEADDHRALHALLASITRNPALELFVDSLNRLTGFYFSDRHALKSPVLDASARAHARIADAVIDGNGDLASRRMATHLRAEADFIRAQRGTRQSLNPTAALRGAEGSKRAEALARELFGTIVADRMQPGDLIGSETKLIERYDVSRAVWREAARILEHHHLAVMRRGPAGGLFVAAPSVAAVADIVAVYLERHGTRPADLMELRTEIELAVIDRVVEQPAPAVQAALEVALQAELDASGSGLSEAAYGLHEVLAGLSGNRVLELMATVLIRLTRLQETDSVPRQVRRTVRVDVDRAHLAIVDAVQARDRNLARHRLRRHLDAVTGFLR